MENLRDFLYWGMTALFVGIGAFGLHLILDRHQGMLGGVLVLYGLVSGVIVPRWVLGQLGMAVPGDEP